MAEDNVYLDYAATTPTDPRVVEAMEPYFSDIYGNPSSLHTPGRKGHEAVDTARAAVAEDIGAQPDEILFTSGGTESDNLAVLGYARAQKENGNHIVVSAIEHHAVLEAAQFLETKEGFDVTYVKPDASGVVAPEAVEKALRPETVLVSIMTANNEIGTIQPVSDIGKVIEKRQAEQSHLAFHTDACQATAYLDINVRKWHVDFLTLNGSKVYGPKGIGVLYTKRGRRLQPLQFGGGQERGLRPGTQNVPGIIGLAQALKIADAVKEDEWGRVEKLRDALVAGCKERIDGVTVNGDTADRLPHHANLSFAGVDAEKLLIYLDEAGIYVSTGAACTSGSVENSHVLEALGVSDARQKSALRITLGRATTPNDVDYVLETLPAVVEKLRSV